MKNIKICFYSYYFNESICFYSIIAGGYDNVEHSDYDPIVNEEAEISGKGFSIALIRHDYPVLSIIKFEIQVDDIYTIHDKLKLYFPHFDLSIKQTEECFSMTTTDPDGNIVRIVQYHE
jgi:hypothetical protein